MAATPLRRTWLIMTIAAVLGLAGAIGWLLRMRANAGTAARAAASASASSGPGARRARAQDPRGLARATVEGKVSDPAGAAIAGATVCGSAVDRDRAIADAKGPACARSEADGRYRLAGLVAGRYAIDASAEGRLPRRWRAPGEGRAPFVELLAGETRSGVDFTLEGGGALVRGTVKDVSGGVVGGALVTVLSSGKRADRGAPAIVRSDAKGAFAAWVAAGPIMVHAWAEGYSEDSESGSAPSDEIEITLTPESVLAGRVIEAGTTTPVPGARVEIELGWRTIAAIADSEGRFRIGRLEPGRYKPSATAPGRVGKAKESVLLGLGQTSAEVVIEVFPAANVAGRVLVAPANEPCAEGVVELAARGGEEGRTAPVERDGSARFDGMLPGHYDVKVECKDHVAEAQYPPVIVAAADVEGLVWTVRRGLEIRGRVVDQDDQPVNAHVIATTKGGDPRAPRSDADTNTEADGSFVVRGLLAATYEVGARAGEHPAPDPIEVVVSEGRAPEVKIVMSSGGAIEGSVVDQSGKPVARVDVYASGPKRRAFGHAVTLGDGGFSMKGLDAGEYQVRVRKHGTTLKSPSAKDDDQENVSVAVKAGETTRAKIVVERLDGEIRGRVVDEIGEPVTDAFVDTEREKEGGNGSASSMRRRARWSWMSAPALTDPDGRFVVSGLAEGKYTVHAYRKGGGDAFAEHVAAGSEITLVIQKTGAISGSVTLPKGGPAEAFTITVVAPSSGIHRSEPFLHTGGAFTLRDLPEGNYEISAEAAEGTGAANASLALGEQKQGVAIALTSRAGVKGTVVALEGGAPVAGTRVGVKPRNRWSPMVDDPEKNNVTDARGAFVVEGAPAGAMEISLIPSDWRNSEYAWASIPVDLAAGTMNDVGKLLVPKRRVGVTERSGDLGFYVKDRPPDVDPAKAVLEVESVRPSGPAAAAGLLVGDVIVSIDGYDVTGRMSYLYTALIRVREGTTVTLGLSRGAQMAITAGKGK